MAVIKNITVQITKADATAPMFCSVIYDTLEFPPEYAAKVMTLVTGWTPDDDDHNHLNSLHCHGKCGFRFGKDWEFYLAAEVTYND